LSLWVKSSDLISWARTLNGPLTFGPTGDRFETAAHAASLQSPYASYWDSWAHPPSTISGPMTKTVGVRGLCCPARDTLTGTPLSAIEVLVHYFLFSGPLGGTAAQCRASAFNWLITYGLLGTRLKSKRN